MVRYLALEECLQRYGNGALATYRSAGEAAAAVEALGKSNEN